MADGDTVAQPKDGMAVLYIEVKDTWDCENRGSFDSTLNGDLDLVSKCYKLVQFVPYYMRVSYKDNPGYLFTIDKVTSNRFFYASKGRWREDSGSWPLWGTFEEISPNDGGGNTPTLSLAAQLDTGAVYSCIHSCGSVPLVQGNQYAGTRKYGHEFVLTEGQLNAFTGLTLFVPDRRQPVKPNKTDDRGTYNTAYQPKSFLYKASLTAEATRSSKAGYYDVTLNWDTWMRQKEQAKKVGVDLQEQYYVYVVDPVTGKYTLIDKVDNNLGGDPNYPGPVKERTHTYQVPQQSTAQTITFIISANPLDSLNTSNIYIYSNTASVTIPGNDAFFMQAGEYRSRFDVQGERNVYRNTISITPKSWNDLANAASTYRLTRVGLDAKGAVVDSTVLATVNFSEKLNLNDSTRTYSVTYNADAQQKDADTFDGVAPFTSAKGTLGVKGDSILLVDRFAASTAQNAQPRSYRYRLFVGSDGPASSNAMPVPVFTTTGVGSRMAGISKAEVEADKDCSVSYTPRVRIEFNASVDAARTIDTYETVQVSGEQVTGYAKRTDESLSLINHRQGKTDESLGTVTPGVAGQEIALYDEYDQDDDPYTVRINTKVSFDGGKTTVPNSYGANRTSVKGPQLTFTADEVNRSKSVWDDGKGNERAAYGATLHLTPGLPEGIPNVYYYRLWRKDGNTTLLNELTDTVNAKQGWGTSYGNIQGTYLPTTSETSVRDIYLGNKPDGIKKVTYVARMYSTIVPKGSSAARKSAATAADGYYITEKTVDVHYTEETVTGVTDVNEVSPVASVTYYSVTGQQSATPWQGVNIQVTRYANGTTSTRKLVK